MAKIIIKLAKEDLFGDDRWVDIDSSFIEEAIYYDIPHIMELRLKGGRKYTFMDVPPEVYQDFLKSPSKGKFFNSVLRQKYTTQ